MTVCDRRCALCAVGASALVGCFFGDSGGPEAGTPDAESDALGDAGDATAETDPCTTTPGKLVGAVTDFPVGTWKLVVLSYADNYIVSQDTNGFFAFSAICTHQGCIVDQPATDGSTFCPCHGSRFDGNGNVTAGPAYRPLQHYAVAICNGDVYVDSSNVVSESTRTPPQ